MPAIARSEPFREQACPLGVCDGSGWILGPEDVARPCECRAERLNRGRGRGVSSDRPPVSDMARDMEKRIAVMHARDYVDNLDENIAAGRGVWFMGGTG